MANTKKIPSQAPRGSKYRGKAKLSASATVNSSPEKSTSPTPMPNSPQITSEAPGDTKFSVTGKLSHSASPEKSGNPFPMANTDIVPSEAPGGSKGVPPTNSPNVNAADDSSNLISTTKNSTKSASASKSAPPANSPNINASDDSSNLISTTTNASKNSTKSPKHNLIQHCESDSMPTHDKTRVVIEGFERNIITAMLTGYKKNGLCHITDNDDETEYFVPKDSLVRFPNDFNDREPSLPCHSKVYAVYPNTDTLYPGVISDNETVDNHKVAVVFVADDGKDDIQMVPIVDILTDEQVLATRLICGICDKQMYRTTKKQVITAICVKCKKHKFVHHGCLQQCHKGAKGSIEDNFMICEGCLSPCFLCGTKHDIFKPKVELYKCKICPSDREMWTTLIPPNRFSSKGDTGCLSMMAVNQREKLKPGVYPCNECAVESLYNFKHGKVFHDGMDDTVQEKLLSAIENHLIYGTVTECKLYLNREQIIEIMRKHFLHLKKKTDNIFLVNNPKQEDWCGFYLPFQSLERLMSKDVIVDVHMMTFLVQCLNGPLYLRSKRVRDRQLRKDDDDKPEYHLQIGEPNDDPLVNVTLSHENIKKVNCNTTKAINVYETFYRSVLSKWVDRIIPEFGLDRKYKAIAPTMIQIHDDWENISNYDDTKCKFIIPIYNGRWRMIDVEMPHSKGLSNGMVKILDNSPQRAKTGYESHLSATMWYAKFFGTLWALNDYDNSNLKLLRYVRDMNIVKFKFDSRLSDQDEEVEIDRHLSTTLDHRGFLSGKMFYKNPVAYNDGVLTARELIYRSRILFVSNASKPLVHTSEKHCNEFCDLVCNLILTMFKHICPENKYVYNPEVHDCDDDIDSWRKVVKEVMGKGFNSVQIWDLMKKKCKINAENRPRSVGNIVNVYDHYNSKSFQRGVKIEELTLFMRRSLCAKIVGTKIISINGNTDLKKQLTDLVVDCYQVKAKPKRNFVARQKFEALRKHISDRLLDSTTYFLIDHKEKRKFLEANKEIQEYQMGEDGRKEKRKHEICLCGVLIIEKEVQVQTKLDCIIHYLCVKEGCEGLGYATKMLCTAFKDKDIANKRVHCVSSLPSPYRCRSTYNVNTSRSKNYGGFYLKSPLAVYENRINITDLIFPKATVMVGKGNDFSQLICSVDENTNTCAVYVTDNFTRTAILCSDDNTFYTKSIHFGWMKEMNENVIDHYPAGKLKDATDYKGCIVHFRDGGAREKTINRKLLHGGDDVVLKCSTVISPPIHDSLIPPEYYQIHYDNFQNGCVWLATCQLMLTLNRDLAHRMIIEYQKSPSKYEYIRLFNSKRSEANSLKEHMLCIEGNEYRISHVKPTEKYQLTDYVLNVRKCGYFVGILRDKYGGRSHAISFDLSKRIIYDCMEKTVLKLNIDSLNQCCGKDRKFDKFEIVAELNKYRKKLYCNNKKRKATPPVLVMKPNGQDIADAIVIDDSEDQSIECCSK